jgi:transcriptional regulator with XRE-family HTH domain
MLSQRELARAIGTAQAAISRLERGNHRAQPRTVRLLAEALGVEPTELVKP